MSAYLDHLKKCSDNNKLIHATDTCKKMIDHIEKLEGIVWRDCHSEACGWGATATEATEFANKQLEEI